MTSIAMPRASDSTSNWLLVLIPGLIWGTSFLFIAEGLKAIGPFGLTFTRILVGFVTLGLIPTSRNAVPRKATPGIIALGVLWFAFPLSMFPIAEQHVSSALVGMLNGAIPLFTAIVAVLMTKQFPPRPIMIGLAVGLLGTVLIAGPSLSQGGSSAVGVMLSLSGVISYGFVLTIARPLQQLHGTLPIIWRAQAVGLVLTAPLGIPELMRADWSLGAALAVLSLGGLGTGVAYVLVAVASRRTSPTRASATTFLIPVVALALGVLVRGEQVAAVSVAGGIVCVAGAWIMTHRPTPRPAILPQQS